MANDLCDWPFFHNARPRDRCCRPIWKSNRCCFHSDDTPDDLLDLLTQEVSRKDHWLEGALVNRDLQGLNLIGARLPSATLEGVRMSDVLLSDALLEGANFRGAVLSGVVLAGADIRGAAFDRAIMTMRRSSPCDFRRAIFGNTSFIGAKVQAVRLLGARFQERTPVDVFVDPFASFEMTVGIWDEATAVFAALGKRATEDWDFSTAETAAFIAMTCRHRKEINARALHTTSSLRNWGADWLVPTVRARYANIRTWGWLVSRVFWGYGLRPLRLALAMICIVLLFASIFRIISLSCESAYPNCNSVTLWDTFIFSLNTFVGLTYSPVTPRDNVSALIAGVEALLGVTCSP